MYTHTYTHIEGRGIDKQTPFLSEICIEIMYHHLFKNILYGYK